MRVLKEVHKEKPEIMSGKVTEYYLLVLVYTGSD